jgi:nucleoside-diphosphate-sugar epimerase
MSAIKAFVTGGSGFVGREFIRYLLENPATSHYSLVVLSRSAKSDELINSAAKDNPRVSIVRGDLTNMDALLPLVKGCNTVFHIASKVEPWGRWAEFMEANVNGTVRLLEAAKHECASTFVYVSSEAALLTGLNNGCLHNVDETAPLALDPPFYAPYTKSKAMAEQAVSAASSDGFVTVIVRPRFVWGKGDTNLLPALQKAIETGTFKWFKPDARSHTCHVENLCEGLICAAEKGKAGQAYFLTDGESVVWNEFIARMLMPVVDMSKVGELSVNLAWDLATFLEYSLYIFGYNRRWEPPVSRQILGLMTQDVLLSDRKAREELGYTSHMSKEQGLRELHESLLAAKNGLVEK